MKKKYLPIIIALFVSALSVPAQAPKGNINLKGVAPDQVLLIYSRTSGLALIEDSRVRQIHRRIYMQATGVSKSDLVKLLEDALIKQAGVVITHLDDKSVSVTYNDALPIAGSKH